MQSRSNRGKAYLCIGGQRVELALVPQNGVTQSRHHNADCPARVALQLDDLVSATQNDTVTNNNSEYICTAQNRKSSDGKMQ